MAELLDLKQSDNTNFKANLGKLQKKIGDLLIHKDQKQVLEQIANFFDKLREEITDLEEKEKED